MKVETVKNFLFLLLLMSSSPLLAMDGSFSWSRNQLGIALSIIEDLRDCEIHFIPNKVAHNTTVDEEVETHKVPGLPIQMAIPVQADLVIESKGLKLNRLHIGTHSHASFFAEHLIA